MSKKKEFTVNRTTKDPWLNLLGAMIESGIKEEDEEFFESTWGKNLCGVIGMPMKLATDGIEQQKGKREIAENLHKDHRRERRLEHQKYLKNYRLGTKIPVLCVETGEIFSSVKEAEEKYGIDKECIRTAARGTNYTSGGFHWQYQYDLVEVD